MKVKLELTDGFTSDEVVVEMSSADYAQLLDMLEGGYTVSVKNADPM